MNAFVSARVAAVLSMCWSCRAHQCVVPRETVLDHLLVIKSREACKERPLLAGRVLTLLLYCAGKPTRDTGSAHEQQFVRAVIDLHDKYMQVCS